jgi:hypothetical protein
MMDFFINESFQSLKPTTQQPLKTSSWASWKTIGPENNSSFFIGFLNWNIHANWVFNQKMAITSCSQLYLVWMKASLVACDFRESHKNLELKVVENEYERGYPN